MFQQLLSIYQERTSDRIFAYQYFLAIRFVVSLLVGVIMVKSALPARDLGYYEVIFFIVNSLSFFWSIGIKNGLLSYYPGVSDPMKPSLLSTVFWILLGLSGLISLFLFIFSDAAVLLFTDFGTIPFMSLGALFLLFSIPLVMIENVLFLRNQTGTLIKYTHYSHVGYVMLIIAVSVIKPDIFCYIWATILWALFRMCYLVFFIYGNTIFSVNIALGKLMLLFSLPLMLNVLLGSGMDIIDGLFVSHYFSEEFFAIFRYGAREMPFSSLLFSSLSTAMIPILITQGIGSDQIKIRVSRLMHFVFPVAIVLMLVSPMVFPLIYNSQFKESAYIFNVYLLILTSRVLLPQTYNFALHQHGIILWSGIIEIMANILLSYWWLTYFGVYGLAMGTVVAYFVQKIILIIYNHRVNRLRLNQYLDIKWYVIYTTLLLSSFILSFIYFR